MTRCRDKRGWSPTLTWTMKQPLKAFFVMCSCALGACEQAHGSTTHAKKAALPTVPLAGRAALPDVSSLSPVTVTCDSSVRSVDQCDDVACPELPASASTTCTVNCCTSNGKCGTRYTGSVNGVLTPEICIESAVADARCPSTMIGSSSVAGCCDIAGRCGVLSGTGCAWVGSMARCD